MKNPVTAKHFELEAHTENITGKDVRFTVAWLRDHADWDGIITSNKNFVEAREIPGCAGLPCEEKVSGTKTSVKWPVNWLPKDLDSNTEMEIYAVIRAEYRFIKDNGWTKIKAKKHSQGFDNLFEKGQGKSQNYAIVESKCFGDRTEYDKYVVKNPSKSPLGKLATPQGELVDGKPMSANGIVQMSDPWVSHAFLQEAGGTPDPAVEESLNGLADWMYVGRKRMPLRYLNVYAPPTSGFYLLAGDYQVRCVVGSLNNPQQNPNNPNDGRNLAKRGPLKADWGDKTYVPLEFFALDFKTVRKPGITGDFHDFAAEFRDLCRKQRVNAGRAASASRRVANIYKS